MKKSREKGVVSFGPNLEFGGPNLDLSQPLGPIDLQTSLPVSLHLRL